jgi:predicted NAD-dependent protein-ADP-ribosyltransferase YbiA (DUF1768 family)
MVVSRIERTLSYPETRSIFPADRKNEVDLYSIFVKGLDIVVAIGNASHTYVSKNIVYYPIYMIKNTSKATQIGIYEIKTDKVLSVTDHDGSLMLDKIGEPLIYTFATKKMINEHRMVPPTMDDNAGKKEEPEQTEDLSHITNTTIPALRSDIFTFDASTVSANRSINTYVEETRQSAEKLSTQFEKPPSGHSAGWLQTIMRNNHYETHENDGKNDSLFMVIRDAFLQNGQSTTVVKLREKLAPEATQELFDDYASQYKISSETLLTETKRAKGLQTEYAKYETMIKSTISVSDQRTLINSAKHVASQHKSSLSNAKAAREMLNDFKFMKGVNTLDALRKKIQTPDYPGDAWTVSTLERILNIKLIVLSSDYVKNDPNNMMQCGNVIDPMIKSRGSFAPEFYIMTECTADMHYRLISYRNKRLFTYIELPYDIKQLVVTKCIERNSGIFTLITSFRQMTQGRIGNAKYDENSLDRDIVDTLDVDVLAAVDPHVVFQFYAQSADKSAGRGTGEKIDANGRKLDFAELANKGEFPNWRRKLDDMWTHTDMPFELDGQQWNSVEHYVQAGKFKNEHPEFYKNFTAGSKSKMSKDAGMANAAADPKAPTNIRPATVLIDPTYNSKRENTARVAAINAKFTQNQHFTKLLLATKNAMLYHYTPGKKPEVATNLILIRKNLV